MSNMSNNIISRNPNILGGTPVFAGTRVPISSLMRYLAAGYPLNYFLHSFPSVSREQALQLLELATEMLTGEKGQIVDHQLEADK